MKIENIIEDIINDMRELIILVEEILKKESPYVDVMLFLPGIEKLTTVKVIELTIREKEKTFLYSVEVHTHNGNRVFEKMPEEVNGNNPDKTIHHPLYEKFVAVLRAIIKRKKIRLKPKLRIHYLSDEISRCGQYRHMPEL